LSHSFLDGVRVIRRRALRDREFDRARYFALGLQYFARLRCLWAYDTEREEAGGERARALDIPEAAERFHPHE